jgi:hypothetical protein
MYIFMKVIFKTNLYLYDFCSYKLNGLEVIHDLYSQCLTQNLSKTTSNIKPEYHIIKVINFVSLNMHMPST